MKLIRRLFCRVGWHSFPAGYDWDAQGAYRLHGIGGGRARCRWCGGMGLVDSQGNMFAVINEGKT